MNSFSHAFRFLDGKSYFAIGCALPDWLGAVDRRCRVRKNGAGEFVDHEDSTLVEIAGGIIQHIDDDRWFHSDRTFNELNMAFALELRELLADEPGFRPGFLGHIIIELLLDGFLQESYPGRLEKFYEMVAASDPDEIQAAVNQMATRPTDKLARYFPVFLRERYLFDYVDDERLIYRVNYVLKRVKLKPVGDEVINWVPSCRKRVYESAHKMLEPFDLELTENSSGKE